MVLVAVLVFLLLRQIMPIAAGLSGGIALSTFGTLSRLVSWGMRRGVGATQVALALGASSLVRTERASPQPLRITRAIWR